MTWISKQLLIQTVFNRMDWNGMDTMTLFVQRDNIFIYFNVVHKHIPHYAMTCRVLFNLYISLPLLICVLNKTKSKLTILILIPIPPTFVRPSQSIENCYENGFGYTNTNITVEG